jgi:hypothetical protein
MKRDMDLARKILFEVEKEEYTGVGFEIDIVGFTKDETNYHIMLLNEAGLVEIETLTFGGDYRPTRLTWEGHEFVDVARDNKLWEKAKSAMSQAGGFALEVAKQLLIQYLKTELKLP